MARRLAHTHLSTCARPASHSPLGSSTPSTRNVFLNLVLPATHARRMRRQALRHKARRSGRRARASR
eukprot:6431450-Alexandrium_andersonii.AAC.1